MVQFEVQVSCLLDLQQMSFEEEPENPKLLKMQEIILDVLGNNENGRGIIFVKTRELAKALIAWMHETHPLTLLNATEFVGQTASTAEGGNNKYLLIELLHPKQCCFQNLTITIFYSRVLHSTSFSYFRKFKIQLLGLLLKPQELNILHQFFVLFTRGP